MLDSIDEETVDFEANYETRLSSRRPAVTLSEPFGQRSQGIAVGMATKIRRTISVK